MLLRKEAKREIKSKLQLRTPQITDNEFMHFDTLLKNDTYIEIE